MYFARKFFAAVAVLTLIAGPAAAAVRMEGQVQVGGGSVASSTVTLWAASAGEPKQLVIWNPSSPHYRRALGLRKESAYGERR